MTSTATDDNNTVPVYVLYGSQTGNCEQHAIDFCGYFKDEAKKLGSDHTLDTHHLQLDDFLEMQFADFPKTGALLVIFVSSYGVGQAPLGAYRFRDVCDQWNESAATGQPMKGLHYAMCGLGDSMYPTFFQNPTEIDLALTKVGAKRIGALGKADASQSGDDAQDKVVQRWRKAIVKPLLDAIPDIRAVTPQRLKEMQQCVMEIVVRLDPEIELPDGLDIPNAPTKSKGGMSQTLLLAGGAIAVGTAAMALSSTSQ